MKIKQQKQVKSYLIEEFGPNKGNEIFDKQEKELYKIIKKTKKLLGFTFLFCRTKFQSQLISNHCYKF